MRIGTALVLIAIGAILRYAVDVTAEGFNIHTIGVILMVVGVVGLVISLVLATTVDRRPDRPVSRERDVY
jgi:hypothetical protein